MYYASSTGIFHIDDTFLFWKRPIEIWYLSDNKYLLDNDNSFDANTYLYSGITVMCILNPLIVFYDTNTQERGWLIVFLLRHNTENRLTHSKHPFTSLV